MHRSLYFAVRRLRRDAVFSLGVIVILALAIGANTAVFTLVYNVLLKPLPFTDPDRLFSVALVRPGTDRQPLSLPDVAIFQSSLRTTHGFASIFGWNANVAGNGDAERLQGARVSADYFAVTGAQVALGRPIVPADEGHAVVVISHGLWQRRFGGSADALGTTLKLNGEPFVIVGVLRPDFVSLVRDPDVVAVYSPASDPRRMNAAQGFVWGVARLKPDVAPAQAVEDFDAVRRRLREVYPDAHAADTGVHVLPIAEEISGRAAPMLRMLMASVGLVLLIASANVANLFLLRTASRRRELAVKSALGASRRAIAGEPLAESMLLALAGGMAGLFVARALVDALATDTTANLPRAAEIGLDLRVAVFTLAVSFGASLVAGAGPVLQALRADVRDSLRDGDRSSTGGGGARRFLVFAEVALSAVLLTTAALLARSFERVQRVDPGFRPSHVLTLRLALPRARYRNRDAIAHFYEELQPRLAALPGVKGVAAANVVPLNGYLATVAFYVDGVVTKNAPEAHYRTISPDYFDVMGIDVHRGRAFTTSDNARASGVAIVNETFAAHYLDGRNPIGARLRIDDGEPAPREVEVVGVCGNVKHFGLDRENTIEVYVPITQVPDPTTIWIANNMYWVIHTTGDPLALANSAKHEIGAVDPEVPATFVRSMDQWVDRAIAPRRFNLRLVAAFAAMALILSLVGVYTVAASSAAARTREIGIRGALGGTRSRVVTLMIRQAMLPVLCGLAVGVLGSAVAGRAVSDMLFGVTAHDARSMTAVVAVIGLASLMATFLPAFRAARVNPVEALRVD